MALRAGNIKKNVRWVAIMVVALFPLFTPYASAQRPHEIFKKDSAAQVTPMERIFPEIFTPGLELIRKTNRMDMIDYWNADSVRQVKTELDGVAWLEVLTADYVRVRVSPVSSVEMKVLPAGKKKIVACVYTVGDSVQARDSEVNFYDAESLRPLPKQKYFKAPNLLQFFNIGKNAKVTLAEIREMVPFPTVAYSLSPTTNYLKARLTVEDYISREDWETLLPYVRHDLQIPWKGKFKF